MICIPLAALPKPRIVNHDKSSLVRSRSWHNTLMPAGKQCWLLILLDKAAAAIERPAPLTVIRMLVCGGDESTSC